MDSNSTRSTSYFFDFFFVFMYLFIFIGSFLSASLIIMNTPTFLLMYSSFSSSSFFTFHPPVANTPFSISKNGVCVWLIIILSPLSIFGKFLFPSLTIFAHGTKQKVGALIKIHKKETIPAIHGSIDVNKGNDYDHLPLFFLKIMAIIFLVWGIVFI